MISNVMETELPLPDSREVSRALVSRLRDRSSRRVGGMTERSLPNILRRAKLYLLDSSRARAFYEMSFGSSFDPCHGDRNFLTNSQVFRAPEGVRRDQRESQFAIKPAPL